MQKLFIVFLFLLFLSFNSNAQVIPLSPASTVANPLNLSYRYYLGEPSRREAADPTVINYKGEYYLFASKSGGYWHSTDLIQWDLITTSDLPLEDYAPTAVVVGDTILFMASTAKDGGKIFKTADPRSGKWLVANAAFPIALTDPALFLDEDRRLYLYYGCSNVNPLYVVELDRNTLMPLGSPIACINSNKAVYGWERFGDYNERPERTWIEGAWMTKVKGKYYLQYASPGTEFKSYCDGLYIADTPVGPFRLAPNNPFSYKPSGFIAGAGHSSTFQDKFGNYWRISTMTISVNHRWERRLGIFPAFFNGTVGAFTYTGYGDYPIRIPRRKINGPGDIATEWHLLSYAKKVSASSTLTGFSTANAVDEDVRTWWSAKTGDKGEWLTVDLLTSARINAVQLNFADQDNVITGRPPGLAYQYQLEYSNDGRQWRLLADKKNNQTDAPHDYIELRNPVKARFLRLTNFKVPGGKFAVSDFRVFGKADGVKPVTPVIRHLLRNDKDRCRVKIQWSKSKNADGYTIGYGTAAGKPTQWYQVSGRESVEIGSLNRDQRYYFTIESFNGSGVSRPSKPYFLK